MRSLGLALVAILAITVTLTSPVAADCADIAKALAGIAADLTCLESTDLTTRNEATTPQDNSRLGLPPNAFTPRTDAQAVSPDAPFRTAIDPGRTFPGLQITGAMADDPNARWLLRLPASANWNGRLVVGVPGGFRSEFMGDYIFSDLVVQQGFAYVSTNKGMLNFFFTAPGADPAACRLSPRLAATGAAFTHFYANDAGNSMREWFHRTLEATDVAELAIEAQYGRAPARVYLMGISNGGHVVRRLLAENPTRYDGGLDWEGVFWSPAGPNILVDVPQALRTWGQLRQSCCNFVQLEFIQPHAHRAFQLLIDWVERSVPPPASQCIPRGGAIAGDPAGAGRPERRASLLVE